jgi:hypothetical protein
LDTTLVVTGVGLTIYAVVMLLAYFWIERGSFLDPIVVSWVGYIVFIPISMIGTGILYPDRDTATYGKVGCVLMVLGTLMYTLGLYCGKAIRFSRRLPSPKPTVSKSQIWVALLISAATYPALPFLWKPLVEAVGPSAGTILYETLFSITLISVIGAVVLKGSPISRLIMTATAAAASFAILWTIFSRRPLAGVLIAVVGLIYHFRIATRSALVKLWYFGGLTLGLCVLLIYLDATRAERYYGKIAGPSLATFSAANYERFFAGVEMNYRIYEYALQQIPSVHHYLYGSGYVPGIIWFPRALWPSKPNGTGYVLSQWWFQKEAPESNVGLPTMGEAYANFGVIGMAVILFLIGRLVRVMNSYLLIHYDNVILWATWLLLAPNLIGEWRGDFTSMTSQALLQIIGFFPVMWFAGKVAPGRPIRAMEARKRMLVPANRFAWNGVRPLAVAPQGRLLKRG